MTDIRLSIDFYSRPGLPVARRMSTDDHSITFMGDGETLLELIGDRKGPVDHPFVFIGFTSGDAEALARILNEKCVGPISPGPGVEFWFVRDPDGFAVQILKE